MRNHIQNSIYAPELARFIFRLDLQPTENNRHKEAKL